MYNMKPGFDSVDADLLAQRLRNREKLEGRPLVGDFVRMLDGTLRRFAHDWGDDIQPTTSEGSGSFYLCQSGHGDHSGSLHNAIPKNKLVREPYKLEGAFWFFHHDCAGGNQGVRCLVGCQVFKVLP